MPVWLGLTFSQWFVIAVFVAVIFYTAVAQKMGQPTVSMTLRDGGWRINTIPFIFGLLVGHWFFPRQSTWVSGWGYAIPALLALVIYDVLWNWKKGAERRWFRFPGWWFLLGLPVGIWLWAQRSGDSPIP